MVCKQRLDDHLGRPGWSEGSGCYYRVGLEDLFVPLQLKVPDETLAGLIIIGYSRKWQSLFITVIS